MNRCSTMNSCALLAGSLLLFGLAQTSAPLAAQTTPQAPASSVPDAPTPQAPKPLSDVQITPGSGTQRVESNDGTPTTSSSTTDNQAPQQPSSQPPAATAPDTFQTEAPATAEAGKGSEAEATVFRTSTTAVEVPVLVRDTKGRLVAGLTWRDFRIFENNQRQPIHDFYVDPFPLSIAYVIDQSVTADVMAKVNNSLGAIQGSLTPYDEAAIFTYNNGAKEATGFTGGQSHRLEAVLALSKAAGREEGVPVNSGPLAGCGITSNGDCVDPNLQPGRSAGNSTFMTIPKEIHTLNDAILRAAVALANRPYGRRRIIYVISDGKEYGSKATTKEVIKYCQGHNIAVYATLVGDSARWGQGYLSRFHIPFQMRDDILPKYTLATGGALDSEPSLNGIERSYQRLAEDARNQYTIVYYSHQPAIDGKYRSIDVRVARPSKEIEVTAKPGYYPTAQDVR